MGKLTLGQKLKQARLDKGLTQQEVVGDFITRNMLSKIENDVANPSIKTIEYLAEKLNKPVTYFLENMISTTLDTKSNSELTFEHSSYMIKKQEYDNCISYLEDILSKSSYNTSDIYYGRILYNFSYSYRKISKLDEALQNIITAIHVLEKNKDYYHLSKSHQEFASIYFLKDNHKDAQNHLEKAIAYLNKSYVRDVVTEVELYHNLSLSLYKQNKNEEALKSVMHTLEISKKIHYYFYAGASHMLASRIYSTMDNLTKAIEQAKKSVFFFDLKEDYNLKAKNTKNLGHYYFRIKNYEESQKYFEKALVHFIKQNNYNKANSTKIEILRVKVKTKQYTNALEYSKEIDKKYMDNSELAHYLVSLGEIYLSLNDLEKSKQHLLKGEQIVLTENNLQLLSDIYIFLADLYSKQEDYKNAYIYSNKSSNLLKDTTNSRTNESEE